MILSHVHVFFFFFIVTSAFLFIFLPFVVLSIFVRLIKSHQFYQTVSLSCGHCGKNTVHRVFAKSSARSMEHGVYVIL